MVRLWVCAALLLSAGLAGCVGDETTDGSRDPLAGVDPVVVVPDAIEWGLTGCQAAVLIVEVPAASIQPHLPEGFKPLPSPQGMTGLAANPTDGGSFGVEMFTCESGIGWNETVTGIAYGSYFAFVEPPAALRDPEVDFHFMKWDVLVPDAARRSLLQEVGVPAHNGSATWSSFALTGSIGQAAGTLDLQGEHRFEGRTAAPAPATLSFVEFTEAAEGLVAWKTSGVTSAIGLGTGTVQVPDGTLAAEVLGSAPVDGSLMLFTGDFVGGTITFPATE